MLMFIVRKQLKDMRAPGPTYYYLGKGGAWTWDKSKASAFFPLDKAEEVAKHLEAELERA